MTEQERLRSEMRISFTILLTLLGALLINLRVPFFGRVWKSYPRLAQAAAILLGLGFMSQSLVLRAVRRRFRQLRAR